MRGFKRVGMVATGKQKQREESENQAQGVGRAGDEPARRLEEG